MFTAQKKADHILEISGQGDYCGYCFKNHTCESRLQRLNVTNKFKVQRRLSNRLATVMFRGTPCTVCRR